jgi:hypothetical protein
MYANACHVRTHMSYESWQDSIFGLAVVVCVVVVTLLIGRLLA